MTFAKNLKDIRKKQWQEMDLFPTLNEEKELNAEGRRRVVQRAIDQKMKHMRMKLKIGYMMRLYIEEVKEKNDQYVDWYNHYYLYFKTPLDFEIDDKQLPNAKTTGEKNTLEGKHVFPDHMWKLFQKQFKRNEDMVAYMIKERKDNVRDLTFNHHDILKVRNSKLSKHDCFKVI